MEENEILSHLQRTWIPWAERPWQIRKKKIDKHYFTFFFFIDYSILKIYVSFYIRFTFHIHFQINIPDQRTTR